MEPSQGSPIAKLESAEVDSLQLQLGRQFQQLISKHPSLNIDQVFYLQASRLYIELINKQQEVSSLQEEVERLQRELGIETTEHRRSTVQAASNSLGENGSQKKKRMRRTAVEIARHYVCTIDKCNKSYGSEGSLNQHIKIKHKNHYTKQMLMMDLNRPQ